MIRIKRFNESLTKFDTLLFIDKLKPYVNNAVKVYINNDILSVEVGVPSDFKGGENEKNSLESFLIRKGFDKYDTGSYSIKIESEFPDKPSDIEKRISKLYNHLLSDEISKDEYKRGESILMSSLKPIELIKKEFNL